MTAYRGLRRAPAKPRVASAAPLLLAALLAAAVACGGGSEPTSGVGGSKSGATPIFSGATTATIEATPPTNTPPTTTPPVTTPVATGAPSGTVTIAGTRYAFTVRACTLINGQHYLVGDGEATIALSTVLLIQTPARGSFSVDNPTVSVSGNTLTASGTGINIALPRERPDVTLTATCTGLAN
ncbi:MAG: hypothetical protein K1X87_08095 [Dehalococcoidia bacterium]|nr:hypothetical protein [Dehalococcoidia bacterium]HRC63525.1 hypothetical protein [Dehalococcoidia bacterium]